MNDCVQGGIADTLTHNRPAHRQCECFEIQSFTIETYEIQQETHTM